TGPRPHGPIPLTSAQSGRRITRGRAMNGQSWMWIAIGAAAFVALVVFLASLHKIGANEVGLVTKRLSFRKLSQDNLIAFDKEPGYQADLLMPGLRFKFWLLFGVQKHPWVQVPAGEIGVVIAQVGRPLPIGA